MRNSNTVGGLLLLFFGLVFLAGNFGYIEPGYFYRLGQLWPLWLVVAGFMLMSRTYPALRYAAGAVVALMLIVAVWNPEFLDSFAGGYRWRHHFPWPVGLWGLIFLAGAVWVLYSLFGRKSQNATK